MRTVNDALLPLAPEAKARVLGWILSVHQVDGGKPARVVSAAAPAAVGSATQNSDPDEVEDLASLYNRANPDTDAERVLVCSYWHQYVQQRPEVTGQEVNDELKNLGHGVANVTVAFNRLKEQRPALVMQVRKDGTTKQARKKYRVTVEGKKAVEAMFRRGEPE